MNCGQAERWMDAALDYTAGIGGAAEVSPARMAALEDHLAACPTCRRQWDALQMAEAVLRVPRPVAAPAGLLAEFRSRLEAETAAAHPAPRVSRSRWAWLWPAGSLAVGAAAALVVAFGVQAPTSSVRPQAPVERAASSFGRGDVRSSSRPLGAVKAAPAAPPRLAPGDVAETLAAAPRTAAAGGARPAAPPRAEARGRSASVAAPGLDRMSASFGALSAGSAGDSPARGLGVAGEAVADTSEKTGPGFSRKNDQLAKLSVAAKTPSGSMVLEQRMASGIGAGRGDLDVANVSYRLHSVALLASANGYVQVSVAPLPPELNVSAAVLNALQRDVAVDAPETSVRELADQLGEAADVVLKVDAKLALTNVSVQETGAPLWRVLEDAARQGGFEIYPRENTLVLRRLTPQPAGEVAPPRTSKPEPEKAAGAAPTAKAPLRRSKVRAAKPRAPVSTPLFLAVGGPLPDRQVWPAAWGNLPERGFAVPSSSELPALALSRDSASPREIPRIRERSPAPTGGAAPPPAPKPK